MMTKRERQWRVRLIPSIACALVMLAVYISSTNNWLSLEDNFGALAWLLYLVVMTCVQALMITYYVKGVEELPSWWEVAELMTSGACVQMVIFYVGFAVLGEEIPDYEFVVFLAVFWFIPILVMGWIGAGLRGSLKGEMNIPDPEPEADLLDDQMVRGYKLNDE